jgi:hypothetical protein
MSIDPSRHAGERSFERNIDAPLANHVIRTGSQTLQPNGHILHQARDPNNIDHIIQVVTTPHPKKIVTVIRKTDKPFSEEQALAKAKAKEEGEAKARANRSAANRKAQLEKKRARTPKPKNK